MKSFIEHLREAFPFGDAEFDSDVIYEPHVKVSHSLLLRLFEYFHENSAQNDDEDLHDIAELVFEIGADGSVVDMADYDYIVGNDDEDGIVGADWDEEA